MKRMWLKKSIYFFVSLLFYNLIGYSQSWDYSYTHYDKNDGLPSNTVYSICRDRNNIIWFGTDAGLCKFDGNKLEVLTLKNGLPNNDVFGLFCDSKNRVWITTMGSEPTFYSNGFIHNKYNDDLIKRIYVPQSTLRILEDRSRNIWIVSLPFFINCIDSNNNVIQYDLSKKFGFFTLAALAQDGIHFMTETKDIFFRYDIRQFNELRKREDLDVTNVVVQNDSVIFYTNLKNKLVILKRNVENYNFISGKTIVTLFEDNDMIWQLARSGVIQHYKSLTGSRTFLNNYNVSYFCSDGYGNKWISTLGNGLFKINSATILSFKPYDGETGNSISSLQVSPHYITVGNTKGELYFLDRHKLTFEKKIINEPVATSYRILKIIECDGNLYVCTDIGLYKYNNSLNDLKRVNANSKLTTSFKNIYFENERFIVLGNRGVLNYNRAFNKVNEWSNFERYYSFTTYLHQNLFGSERTLYFQADTLTPYPLNQPFHHRIMDMKVDDSLLVVATNEQGIYFIKDHNVLKNISLDDGLNSNSCAKILLYKNDIVIATNNGIALYNRTSGEIRKIMESDGLASNNVHDIAIDQDTLYAGTDKGLSVIPVSSIKSQKSFSFFVNPIIEEKDTIWNLTESITSRTDHTIALTLNALTLGVKGGVHFFYRVREMDSAYATTIDPNIKLSFNKPGKYTFESYGIDVNSLKSVTSLLTIIVAPYWWQTSLFKWSCVFACLFLIFFSIYLIVYYVRKREQIKNARQSRIWKLELDAWKANINPHFLYNSFNTIQSLFSSNKFQIANEFISNFSDVLRRTIDNSGLLMNPSKEEITYLKQYLELECVKRNGRLNYTLECDDIPESYGMIPSLIIQPIIENSIKHGPKKPNICIIEIKFEKQDNVIRISVKDNGPGFPESMKDYTNSKGLQLVRDKIRIVEQITGKLIEFKIENVYDETHNCLGVLAVFNMPFFSVDDYEGRT